MLLAYDDHGPGPVVVLLHGFPLDRSMWSAQVSDVGSIYRLITPDLRGFGQSAAPDGIYTMDDMADDVAELLGTLGIREPIVLGGLSMGGYVAFALIKRHPELVRGLILMDTRAGADTPEAAGGREGLARRVLADGNADAVVTAMLPKLFSPYSRENRGPLIEPIRDVMERTVPRAIAGALRGMAARADQTALLPQIKVPTLVLVGADDELTPPAEARKMAGAIPDARLTVIPDAGHLAPLENAVASNAAILGFLNGLEKG